jgi:hypothetical protein
MLSWRSHGEDEAALKRYSDQSDTDERPLRRPFGPDIEEFPRGDGPSRLIGRQLTGRLAMNASRSFAAFAPHRYGEPSSRQS